MIRKARNLCFVVIILLINGCKKSPELTTTEKKIIGTWAVESFYVDGQDSTQSIKDTCYALVKFYREQFEPYSYKIVNQSTDSIGHCYFYGTWTTYSDIIFIDWASSPNINTGPYYFDGSIKWKIIFIDDTFWSLNTTYNNSFYQLRYKKV